MSKNEFEVLKSRPPTNYSIEKKQVNFTNLDENQLTLFLKVTSDITNTENLFKKLIYIFLFENHGDKSYSEKSAMANIIMSKCSFSLE
jgi:hypothetical protein